MRCPQLRDLLDDLLDDRLAGPSRAEAERHLEGCAACRRELAELRDLLAAARRLPAALEPERDLWPGIQARIQAVPGASVAPFRPRLPTWRRWLPLAAAAALLATLGLPLALRELGGTRSAPSPASHTAALREELPWTPEIRRQAISAETAAQVAESARLLDQAIDELWAALAEYPDSRRLNLLLAERYRQEMELIQRSQSL